ncbi:MAG: hypothetical protein JKY52_07960 [Flavobacteriales bacterium]|nr:hypothetical protein [Flavobacteriales bacterium]
MSPTNAHVEEPFIPDLFARINKITDKTIATILAGRMENKHKNKNTPSVLIPIRSSTKKSSNRRNGNK